MAGRKNILIRYVNIDGKGGGRLMKQKKRKKEVQVLRRKASLTVECAVILPLFFFTVVILAGLLDLYRTTTMIQSTLCESAKELGMYAYCKEEDMQSPVGMVSNSVCQIYTKRKINKNLAGENLMGVVGGIDGIQLIQSSYKDERISLKASFLYKIPFAFLRSFPIRIQIEGGTRAWVGYVPGEENFQTEEMVYVTDWESVYHTSSSCSHLKLSVQSVPYSAAEKRKNIYGEKYHRCEKCMKSESSPGVVFITPTGDCYHQDRECGGLTRHVKLVKKSQVQHLRACERCGG